MDHHNNHNKQYNNWSVDRLHLTITRHVYGAMCWLTEKQCAFTGKNKKHNDWRARVTRGREKLLRNSNNYCFRIARITFIFAGFFDIFQEFPTFIEAAIYEATHSVYDVRSSFD